jgi:hypothetical protein
MEAMIQKFIMAIIGIVIVVTILGSTIGTVATAGNTVNATGYTGASLFASNGILPLIIIMGVLVGVVSLAFALWKKR